MSFILKILQMAVCYGLAALFLSLFSARDVAWHILIGEAFFLHFTMNAAVFFWISALPMAVVWIALRKRLVLSLVGSAVTIIVYGFVAFKLFNTHGQLPSIFGPPQIRAGEVTIFYFLQIGLHFYLAAAIYELWRWLWSKRGSQDAQ